MSDKYLQAAAKAIEAQIRKFTQPPNLIGKTLGWGARPDELARVAIEAWVGDREPLYTIERCEHDTDKHFNAIVMGWHFVGRLEEHLPSCDGSRLVRVSVTEGEPT